MGEGGGREEGVRRLQLGVSHTGWWERQEQPNRCQPSQCARHLDYHHAGDTGQYQGQYQASMSSPPVTLTTCTQAQGPSRKVPRWCQESQAAASKPNKPSKEPRAWRKPEKQEEVRECRLPDVWKPATPRNQTPNSAQEQTQSFPNLF